MNLTCRTGRSKFGAVASVNINGCRAFRANKGLSASFHQKLFSECFWGSRGTSETAGQNGVQGPLSPEKVNRVYYSYWWNCEVVLNGKILIEGEDRILQLL